MTSPDRVQTSTGHCHVKCSNRDLDSGVAFWDGHHLLQTSPLSTGNHSTRRLALCRFALSYRDVEDLLAERGLDISYESVRRWFLKFGAPIARNLRHTRPIPNGY